MKKLTLSFPTKCATSLKNTGNTHTPLRVYTHTLHAYILTARVDVTLDKQLGYEPCVPVTENPPNTLTTCTNLLVFNI